MGMKFPKLNLPSSSKPLLDFAALRFAALRTWRDKAMAGTRLTLGLAIDDTGVVATELSFQAGRVEVRRTGELSWGQELTAESASHLGQRLRQFLREQGFTAKRAVIGLAAKWVLTKEVDAPPAAPEVLASMLSIQAERAFSFNAEELVFDYCGRTSATEKKPVLLLAARRKVVHQIKELAEAAGLRVQAITLSSLACSKVLSQGDAASWYGLYARPSYCEFWAQSDGSPRFLKHVPINKNGTPGGYTDLLASAVERLMLLSPVPGQTLPYRITTCDACGSSEDLVGGLGQRLKPQITVANGHVGLRSRGLCTEDRPQGAGAIAAAVALAGVGPDRPLVDFLNPRMGVKRAVSHKRLLTWGAGIAGACLLGLIILLVAWHACTSDIAANNAWLKANGTQIAAAQEVKDRLNFASSWGTRQPRFLECLKSLTEAFPEQPYVWATSLALNENGTGSVVGKTIGEASFYEVLDKMKQNPVFAEVKMIHIREVGRDSREKEFAISFKLQGAK
jgi:hypothetical protein